MLKFNATTALTNPFSLDDLFCDHLAGADTYKSTHHLFEDPGTTREYLYLEARIGGQYSEITFFGLQFYALYFLTKPVTLAQIDGMEQRAIGRGVGDYFNRKGWLDILNRHGGFLPVRIKALPEGTRTPHGVVLMTIETTDDAIPIEWIAGYLESITMDHIWPGSTVAAKSQRMHEILIPFLERSGTPETVEFKIVDFGLRGDKTIMAAALDGAAHLIYSQVSDNEPAMKFAMTVYPTQTTPGRSVAACEHSKVCQWGEDRELDFFRNIIKTFGSRPRNPDGSRRLVSALIDTYDQERALRYWGVDLKDELIASNMCFVARPDSGDPIINVPHVLNTLGGYYGYTINEKGYKMLPDYARVIQGDAVSEETLALICEAILAAGWSLDNVTFGSGGGLLNTNTTRDTHRFAMKASWAMNNGVEREFNKMPKTDPSKASKRGRFSVVRRNGVLMTIKEGTMLEGEVDLLELVYENGIVHRIMSFDDVRKMARL